MGIKIRNAFIKSFCVVLCWALLVVPCTYLVVRDFQADTAGEGDVTVSAVNPSTHVSGVKPSDYVAVGNDQPVKDFFADSDNVVSTPADKFLSSMQTSTPESAAGKAPPLYIPPVVEEPGVEEPGVEEPGVEEPEVEEPEVEEPEVEEPEVEEPEVEEPEVEEPEVEEPEVEEPEVEEPEVEEPEVEEPENESDINSAEGFYGNYAILTQPNGSNFIYYDQTWDAYASHPYGGATIGGYGCGPTSMAMVVSNLTGNMVTPDVMGDWSVANGYFVRGRGTAYGLFPAVAAKYGIKCTTVNYADKNTIVSALKQGKLVLTIVGPGDFSRGRHFMLIRGITEDGKLLLGDSGKYENALVEWDYDRVMSQVSGGQYWIFG